MSNQGTTPLKTACIYQKKKNFSGYFKLEENKHTQTSLSSHPGKRIEKALSLCMYTHMLAIKNMGVLSS